MLLSSLPGWAIVAIKIAGVKHQFSTVSGMSEDVLQLMLNLKQVRIKNEVGGERVKARLAANGPGTVVAGDVEVPAGVSVANPDLTLAHLADAKSVLKMDLAIEQGYGYSLASERGESGTVGEMTMDANFSPVLEVNYRVEATRVGRSTDYDRLVLELVTDGTMEAEEAVKQAAQILVDHFMLVVNPQKPEEKEEEEKPRVGLEAARLSVEELGLATRIVNALVRGGYETVADLMAAERADLLQVKNLGEKSLIEVKEALAEKGVKLT